MKVGRPVPFTADGSQSFVIWVRLSGFLLTLHTVWRLVLKILPTHLNTSAFLLWDTLSGSVKKGNHRPSQYITADIVINKISRHLPGLREIIKHKHLSPWTAWIDDILCCVIRDRMGRDDGKFAHRSTGPHLALCA